MGSRVVHEPRHSHLRDAEAPAEVAAGSHALPRLDRAALEGADRGWTVEGRTVVVKARARRIEIA
jgi:hypothetical protein